MPHVGPTEAQDYLASSDEITVYKEEGDEKEQSSENLQDDKISLVTEGEEEKSSDVPGQNDYGTPPKPSELPPRSDSTAGDFKMGIPPPHSGPMSFVVPPYHHPHNGSLGSLAAKVPMVPSHSGSPIPFMVYNGEPFAQPPPAHMGIPPVAIDPKTGIPRPPVYHLGPPGQYPPVFSPDFTHQIPWHTPTLYPPTSAGFRSAYSAAIPVTSTSLPRFGPLSPYPGISHPALISPGPRPEIGLHPANHRSLPDYPIEQKHRPVIPTSSHNNIEKKVHIKKPLNAFMLYMKEQRSKVVAECTLKESAAINQILGRRWHSLTREEQAKYYEMARKERQIHMQLYPGWSARDNYALQVKKKKRKKDRAQDGDGNNLKKCRARFGLDQQSIWCKPCRRKKKCIRYLECADNDDNMGSAGSVETPTPDSNKTEDTDSQDLNITSSPEPPDTKPRLDHNGLIVPKTPSPPPMSHRHHHHHQQPHPFQHHPLSVHQLIQPHFGRRFQPVDHGGAGQPMLTVT